MYKLKQVQTVQQTASVLFFFFFMCINTIIIDNEHLFYFFIVYFFILEINIFMYSLELIFKELKKRISVSILCMQIYMVPTICVWLVGYNTQNEKIYLLYFIRISILQTTQICIHSYGSCNIFFYDNIYNFCMCVWLFIENFFPSCIS